MIPVLQSDLSSAWLEALRRLRGEPNRKAVNLAVTFGSIDEDVGVRAELDAFLDQRAGQPGFLPIDTVANTLFPEHWYVPERAAEPRKHMFELWDLALSRGLHSPSQSYFDRLAAYPAHDGEPVNQLEESVLRLQSQIASGNPKSSAYEVGLSDPLDLRVHAPGRDRNIMGFPCLSHISLTLHDGAIHLTAIYRNQDFVKKAYGNYVGLARLVRFFATEIGVEPGEIMCVASHADASVIGKRDLETLIDACRSALGSAGLRGVDRDT